MLRSPGSWNSARSLGFLSCAVALAFTSSAGAAVPGPWPFAAPFYRVQAMARPVVAPYDADGTPELIGLRNDSLLVYRSVRRGELVLLDAHALGSAPGDLLTGDFDGDGRTEPILMLPEDSVAVIYRLGQAPEVWSVPGEIAFASVLDDPGADGLAVVVVGPRLVVLSNGGVEASLDLPFAPRLLASGQFVADARADVAMTHADTLTVLERTPSGAFGSPIDTFLDDYVEFLRPGRMNGDAWMDLVIMWYDGENAMVRRLTNQGNGSFLVPIQPQSRGFETNHIPHPPTDIAVADLDHDVPDELIFADPCGDCESSIGIQFGSGASQSVAWGGGYSEVTAGDVDGDGWADVIGVGTGIVYSNGGASFGQGLVLDGSYRPDELDMADADGDGDQDLFIVSYEAEPWLLRQVAPASFSRTYLSVLQLDYDTELEVADVDADGDVDLLLSTGTVHSNDGNGVFGTGIGLVPAQEVLVLGDISPSAGLPELIGAGSGTLRAWRQTSPWTFAPTDSMAIASPVEALVMLDVNGDGGREIVAVVRGASDSVLVIARSPEGMEVIHRMALPHGFDDEAFVADLNGDVFGDVVLDAGVALVGSEAGALVPWESFRPGPLVVGDWDKDALDDVAVVAGSSLEVFVNDGGHEFRRVQLPGAGEGPRAVGDADFDHDGDRDLVVIMLGSGHTEDGWISVLWNTSDPVTTSVQIDELVSKVGAGSGLRFANPISSARMHFVVEGVMGDATLELVDVAGRRVARQSIREGEAEIVLHPAHPVRPGVYFAVLRREAGAVVQRRVVVTE